MRITIDLDSTVGTINVSNPASTEGESPIHPAAHSTAQAATLDAGAYSGVALGELSSAEGTAIVPQFAAQSEDRNAGAYSGKAYIGGPVVVSLPTTNAGLAAAKDSPPSPRPDTFGLLTVVGRSKEGLDAGYLKD